MKEYAKLLRIKHYIKNLLIFIPLFFAGEIFDTPQIYLVCFGFCSFSLLSSAVYILNDLCDIEKDRVHPVKRNRPLASGKISSQTAVRLLVACLVFAVTVTLYIGNKEAFFCLIIYFTLNVIYSLCGGKNKPVLDVLILASGFVIRIFYGGFITDVEISKWLYLVIITGSLYVGLGKRRNELKRITAAREVLQYYNASFLEKNMYVCAALVNVFYALWTVEMQNPGMIWTVPFFLIILMCYSLDVERDADDDPVEIIIHDKMLQGFVLLYAACLFLLLYVF